MLIIFLSAFMPSLASYFWLPNPDFEGAPCISSHCFPIEQLEVSGYTIVYEINGQWPFVESEASHYIFLFEITAL